MKIRRSVILYSLGIGAAFASGWMLKPVPEEPAKAGNGPVSRAANGSVRGSTESPAHGAAAAQMRGTATAENWAGTAAQEVAEVQAAMKPGEVNAVLIAKLSAVLNIGETSIRLPRWQALMAMMRPEDAAAVRDIFRQNDKEGRYWPDEFNAYWQRWGFVDGAAAIAAMTGSDKQPDWMGTLMAGWGRSDPRAALAWVREHPGAVNQQGALRGIVYGAGNKKAGEAEALLLANAGDPQLQFLYDRIAHMKVYQEGMSGAKPWFEQLAASGAPDNYKQANLRTMVNLMSERIGSTEAAAFAAKFVSDSWLPAEAGSVMAREWKGDPAGNLPALERIVSPNARQAAASELAKNWAAKDEGELSIWLTKNRDNPFFIEGTRALVKAIASTDPEAAKAWSNKLRTVEAPR